MQKAYVILFCLTTLICGTPAFTQDKADSSLEALKQIPSKYINTIDKKIDKYSSRIAKRTEKTLKKLAKWEEKIKATLQKIDPDAANKLFGNNQLTFASLLEKIKQGQAIQLDCRRQYNKYKDDVTTGFMYLEKSKEYLDSGLAKKIQVTKEKLQQLSNDEDSTDAIQQFIKERKRELICTAVKYMGKSKYLTKMNKEVWYYAETMKNYKEIFSDEAKTEKLVKDVLAKIPGFDAFVKQNSFLAGLFDVPNGDAQLLPGMQTRDGVQQMIQSRITSIGPGAQEIVQQNLQSAHSQINKLHDDIIKKGLANGGGGYSEMPDFKPNSQKTKTLRQRIEYNFNLQFSKSNDIIPSGTDLALGIGYKLNDKSTIGVGASYKLGIGSISKIRFTNEGMGLRIFIDWKLKKQFFISGGFEINYLSSLEGHQQIPLNNVGEELGGAWQKSALLGISKKISVKTKWFKSTKLQLLYDFAAKHHVPASQQILFRVGYEF
ncbi:MAG: hypothetical protein V4685_10330 [Bacteroidota bacterium]